MAASPKDLLAGKDLSRIHADWALLVSQEYRLEDASFHAEALAFAMQIMARFREWLNRTIDGLNDGGYKFVYPDRVFVEPDPAAREWIEDFRQKNVFFSIALEAWLRQVGSVNLMGSHPSWPGTGYAYDDDPSTREPMYTDPLVVELPHDYAIYLYDEWIQMRDHDKESNPFRLDIAPDHLHKANVSGGLPYQLSTDRPQVDGILLNERHAVTFVSYLRLAAMWGGFPGFNYLKGLEYVANTDGKDALI